MGIALGWAGPVPVLDRVRPMLGRASASAGPGRADAGPSPAREGVFELPLLQQPLSRSSSSTLPNYSRDETLAGAGSPNGPDGRIVAAAQSPVMEIFNI